MFKTDMCNYCKEVKLYIHIEDFFMPLLKNRISTQTKQDNVKKILKNL